MYKIPSLTAKATKAELFKAFQEMKEKFEELQREQLPLPQLTAAREEEAKILKKTESFLPEKLEDDIASLNKKVQVNLAELKDKLAKESEKLCQIREAIEIESKRLGEVYNIKLAENTLQSLIADFETKRAEFEKEAKQKREVLEEGIALKKKIQEREEEEYKYNLKMARKKEEDEYQIKQAKKEGEWQSKINQKEEELKNREQVLEEKTEEIENMKKEIEDFPKKLETATKEARQETEKELQKDFTIQKKITETQWLAEKKMFETKISNLQDTIKSQNIEIVSLKKALSEASQKAQSLAIAVIQNAGFKQMKPEIGESVPQKEKQVSVNK